MKTQYNIYSIKPCVHHNTTSVSSLTGSFAYEMYVCLHEWSSCFKDLKCAQQICTYFHAVLYQKHQFSSRKFLCVIFQGVTNVFNSLPLGYLVTGQDKVCFLRTSPAYVCSDLAWTCAIMLRQYLHMHFFSLRALQKMLVVIRFLEHRLICLLPAATLTFHFGSPLYY